MLRAAGTIRDTPQTMAPTCPTRVTMGLPHGKARQLVLLATVRLGATATRSRKR